MDKELIFEVNTRYWVRQLREKYSSHLTLGDIPEEEIKVIAKAGFSWVWLMGIWDHTTLDEDFLENHPGLKREFDEALSGWTLKDVIGSPYSIKNYRIHPMLGSVEDYKSLKRMFAKYDLKVMLDFVPNHYGYQSSLARNHPEYFIHLDEEPEDPELFKKIDTMKGEKWIAYGRDPYFPPWDDTFQLNYFNPETREFMKSKLIEISQICDGVRCDMAMLCTNEVIQRTWGDILERNGFESPSTEFWQESISSLRENRSEFTLMAEVYWDMESVLLKMGFDYAYDKTLYDNLLGQDTDMIKNYLQVDLEYQKSLCRFIENHDEDRSLTVMDRDQSLAAAVVISTIPGMTLFHQGQLSGEQIKIPVQLLTKSKEPVKPNIKQQYHKILAFLRKIRGMDNPRWEMNQVKPATDLDHSKILAWRWVSGEAYFQVAVNYSSQEGNALINQDLEHPLFSKGEKFVFRDLADARGYDWSKKDLKKGLYVNLTPFSYHIFELENRG